MMTQAMLIFVILATVLADQVTKAAALSALSQGTAVPVFPGFNLTLGFNEGASFGMMGGVMAGKPLLMAALTGALARLRRKGEAFRLQLIVLVLGFVCVATARGLSLLSPMLAS